MAKRKSSSDRKTQTVIAADIGTVESVFGGELIPPAATGPSLQ